MCRKPVRIGSLTNEAVEKEGRSPFFTRARSPRSIPGPSRSNSSLGPGGIVKPLYRPDPGSPLSSASMAETDNLPAWTGKPGRYEVWFLTMSDGTTGYWIRYTLLTTERGSGEARLWFA